MQNKSISKKNGNKLMKRSNHQQIKCIAKAHAKRHNSNQNHMNETLYDIKKKEIMYIWTCLEIMKYKLT